MRKGIQRETDYDQKLKRSPLSECLSVQSLISITLPLIMTMKIIIIKCVFLEAA